MVCWVPGPERIFTPAVATTFVVLDDSENGAMIAPAVITIPETAAIAVDRLAQRLARLITDPSPATFPSRRGVVITLGPTALPRPCDFPCHISHAKPNSHYLHFLHRTVDLSHVSQQEPSTSGATRHAGDWTETTMM